MAAAPAAPILSSFVDIYQTPYISTFTKASEIPGYCARLAEMLDRQPLFDGIGSDVKKCKVISLDKWADARICDIFNQNAKKMIGTSSWSIYAFGCGNDRLCDSRDRLIKQGVTLWLFDRERCPLKVMENSYHQILKNMVSGWFPTKIEDHPNIAHKENNEEFFLFIKDDSSYQPDVLIRFIAGRLGLGDVISCFNGWLDSKKGYVNGKIYLWIKKSALENVIDKFGFQFPSMTTEQAS